MPRPLLFQAPQEPIADPKTGLITRAWYMWLMQLIQEFTTAGDVFGPGLSTDNAIARWDGTTGTIIQNSNTTLSDAGLFAFADGVRQTFNPNATNAGINVGAQAGDPSSLVNADLWYNSSTNKLMARINGVSVDIGTSLDYVVMSDGANPPSPMHDGNGNFIYVTYSP
jgi:hypothetical protein